MVFVSRQQPQDVFEKNDRIGTHRCHGVLLGQHGLIDPACFDCSEQHRRCRKQVFPVSLDEAGPGCAKCDDQIGRLFSIECPEIFNKFSLRNVIATPSRDEGMVFNVKRPTRLLDQFTAYFLAPCGPRLESRAKECRNGIFLAERQSRQCWAEQPSRRLRQQKRQWRRPTHKRAASAVRCAMRPCGLHAGNPPRRTPEPLSVAVLARRSFEMPRTTPWSQPQVMHGRPLSARGPNFQNGSDGASPG
jgi:hypothetical protein